MAERELETDELDVEETEESEESEQDILRYEVSSYPSDMTLRVYYDKWKDKQLVVPDFQRHYVWDMVQASKLIESFLIGIPVPGIFLYKEQKTNRLLIIDGQQRIMSVVRFFQGRFDDRVFRLKNVRGPWEGKTYEELPTRDQYQLQDSILRATVVQQQSPDDHSSIYHIFERLNTGGVRLSPMEIRKCVYAGPVFAMIQDLNDLPEWRSLLGKARLDKRMRDAELILRVLALARNWQQYEKPMKSFLNAFMVQTFVPPGTEMPADTRKLAENFTIACSRAVKELGEKPFHLRGRLNMGLLDCTLATVARYADRTVAELGKAFRTMLNDESFLGSVTYNTSDGSVVRERFKSAARYLASLADEGEQPL